MYKSRWKAAFFILLLVNLLVLVGAFLLSRTGTDLPEVQASGGAEVEVALSEEAFERLVNGAIQKSGIEGAFRIQDGFRFVLPVEAYGLKSELEIKAVPYAASGRLHMKVASMDLGNLPLPKGATLGLAARMIDRDGLYFDASLEEIIMDPAQLMGGSAFRLDSLTIEKNRYVLKGQVGEV